MKEADAVLGVLTHLETLVAFVIFLVPGFLSVRAYEAARGGEGRKINEALVDVVIYSFATDVVWLPIFYGLWQIPWVPARVGALVVGGIVGLIATPIVLGMGWFILQRRLAADGIVKDPTPKPWDKMFARINEEGLIVGLVLTLPDGRRIGGKFVTPGFASHYPVDEQLQVGESWVIDQTTGAFVERVKGSYGFIIDKRDILTIEFIDWNMIEPTT